MTNEPSTFRALHTPGAPFIIPNPWDVGSARMLAALGFPAMATTSAGLAFSRGLRDGDASFEEQIDHAAEMAAAIPVPVSGDLENGAGESPESAAETIRRAAAAGLAGCSIEDASGDDRAPIYDFGRAVERIAAAVEAARALSGDFVLTARAENFLHGRRDLDDTLRRLRAFADAGADVIYAPGLPDLDAVRAVCAIGQPVNVLMGGSGPASATADLAAAGVARISVGSAFARLAYGGVIRAAEQIRDDGDFGALQDAAGFAEIEALLPPR